MNDLDTIKVMDGRFAYAAYVEKPATFVMVFPNFSELPVFAKAGGSVDIQGSASNLKEIEITGTKENDLMTKFRQNTIELTPPEMKKAIIGFVGEHPKSLASMYLVNKYFIQTAEPDYVRASQLVELILKENPEDSRLIQLNKQLKSLRSVTKNKRLPSFAAKDLEGKLINNSSLKGKVNVINAWATWNFESQSIQRELKKLKKKYREQMGIISVCLDGGTKDCKRTVERDTINWSTVCDGKMWESPILVKLGISTVPGNIVTDGQGRILASNLDTEELKKKIESILK